MVLSQPQQQPKRTLRIRRLQPKHDSADSRRPQCQSIPIILLLQFVVLLFTISNVVVVETRKQHFWWGIPKAMKLSVLGKTKNNRPVLSPLLHLHQGTKDDVLCATNYKRMIHRGGGSNIYKDDDVYDNKYTGDEDDDDDDDADIDDLDEDGDINTTNEDEDQEDATQNIINYKKNDRHNDVMDTSLINAVINDPDVRMREDEIDDVDNKDGDTSDDDDDEEDDDENENENDIANNYSERNEPGDKNESIQSDENDDESNYNNNENEGDIVAGSTDDNTIVDGKKYDDSIDNEDLVKNDAMSDISINVDMDMDDSAVDVEITNIDVVDNNDSDVRKEHSISTDDKFNEIDANDPINTTNEEHDHDKNMVDSIIQDDTVVLPSSSMTDNLNMSDTTAVMEHQPIEEDVESIIEVTSNFVLNDTMRNKLIKILNYKKNEINLIQPEILQMILQHNLYRPQEGIPSHWFIEEAVGISNTTTATTTVLRQMIVKRILPLLVTTIGYILITQSSSNSATNVKSMYSWKKGTRLKTLSPRPPTSIPTTLIVKNNSTAPTTTISTAVHDPNGVSIMDINASHDNNSSFVQQQSATTTTSVSKSSSSSITGSSIRPTTTRRQQEQKASYDNVDVTWLDKLITRIENSIKNIIAKK